MRPDRLPPGTTSGRWGFARVLRHRNYRLYWVGQFPSVLAQNMQFVALSWLVVQLTNSPTLLGVVGLVQAVPSIALSLLGGAVADRVDRKRLLMAIDGGSGVLFFTLGTLVTLNVVQIWHILLLAAALGCVRSFDQPTRQGLLAVLVPIEEIPDAVPLGSLVWQSMRFVGPATAGMLIAQIGSGYALYAACCSFAVAVLLFSRLEIEPQAPRRKASTLLGDIGEGLHFIRTNELIWALIGLSFFNSVFGMSYMVMMPFIARDTLDVGVQGFGFLQTAIGIGSLFGTVGVAVLAHHQRRGVQISAGAAAFGVLIVGFSASTSYVVSLGLLFLMGAANQVYMTTINVALQLNLPDAFRGRVMGLWGLTWSLQPLGGTIAGAVAEHTGVPLALGMGGVLVTMMALTVAALPRVRTL